MEPHQWNWLKNKLVWLICSVLVIAGGASAAIAHYLVDSHIEVTLNDNGYKVQVQTMEKTVEELLDKQEIELGPGDEIAPALGEELEDGTEVRIDRAFRVTVAADGKVRTVNLTKGRTIKDALDKAYVVLKEKDFTNYDLGEEVSPGDHVRVTRVKEEFLTREENIPYKVVTENDDELKKGTEKVVQEGKEGKKEKKILIAYHDGVEVDREIVEEKVAVKPVDRVIHRGTYVEPKPVSRGNTSREKPKTADKTNTKKQRSSGNTKNANTDRAKVQETPKKQKADDSKESSKASGSTKSFTATAYTHTGNRTKTGVWPKAGMIAVDPKVIPLRSKVYVEFPSGWTHLNGYYQAMDTGGAIKGNIIDVFFEDSSVPRKFGRRKVKITFNK